MLSGTTTAALVCATLLASTSGPSSPSPSPSVTADAPRLDVGAPRNQALLVLGGGGASSIASATAFVVGFDAERELRASIHDEAAADALFNKRTVAAWVAWPTAIVGVAGVATGLTLLVLHDAPEAAP